MSVTDRYSQSLQQRLIDELTAVGIDTPGLDFSKVGEFQRLPLIKGKKSKKDASVKIQGYDPLVVTWTVFKTGETGKFVSENRTILRGTPPERKTRVYQQGKAESLWSWGKEAADAHPYLKAKRVRNYGLRDYQGVLLVPLRDEDGTLQNVQRIYPNSTKRYLKDCRKQGCFFRIGVVTPRIVFCEGYATGATIYEALGWCVIVCFDCYNLEPVASALRRLYRRETFVFAADNDRHTKGNPGLTKAREAAKKHGNFVVWPEFEDDELGSDWNDLEALYGLEGVEVIDDLVT